jgi:hypothetical protein
MSKFQQHCKLVALLPDEKYDMQLFQKISCNVHTVFQLPIQYPPSHLLVYYRVRVRDNFVLDM